MAVGLAWTCRFVLATVLSLSAAWKAGHRVEFRRAFRGLAPRRLAPASAPALWAVAAIEVATAALTLAGTAAGPAVALVVIGAFTARIAGTRSLAECGCWSMSFVADPAAARRLTLLRNGVLLAVAAAALVIDPAGVPASDLAAPAAAGIVLGLVVIELPLIAGVATLHRRLEPRP